MGFIVNDNPNYFYEAMTLVQAYVNDTPPEKLTRPLPNCIPAGEIAHMLESLKSFFPSTDSWLQFYFKQHLLGNGDADRSSIAQIILFSLAYFHGDDCGSTAEQIKIRWKNLRRSGFFIDGIAAYGFKFSAPHADSPQLMWEALQALKLPQPLKMNLLEVVLDCDDHIDRICKLLSPVALALQSWLLPYVRKNQPQREAWRELLSGTPPQVFLKLRAGVIYDGPCDKGVASLRYLQCDESPWAVDPWGEVWCYFGISMEASVTWKTKRDTLAADTLSAFSLLGNRGRANLVRAMMKDGYSVREAANLLGQNPGTVSKDIKCLYHAGILEMDYRNERCLYRVNQKTLRSIFRNIEQYFFDTYES